MDPVSVHAAVESAFNDGDVDALVGLYEPDARMVRDDGTPPSGSTRSARCGPSSSPSEVAFAW